MNFLKLYILSFKKQQTKNKTEKKVLSYPNCNKLSNVLLNNSFNPLLCLWPPDFIVVLHFLFSIDCLLVLCYGADILPP